MEIKDLLGLSTPMCKLIEVMSAGISALSSPWLYERMERAKQKMLVEKKDLERNIMIKDALADQLKDELLKGRDRREFQNVADVVGISASILNLLPEISEEEVNPDWASRFFDYAKGCSDDLVKDLWGRILAGEIQKPGSFSYRTLETLRNMSKEDAELIGQYAHRVFGTKFYSTNVSVFDIARLDDCGFLSVNALVLNLNFKPNESAVIFSDKRNVLLGINKSEKAIKTYYSFYELTQAGREIMTLIEAETTDEDLHCLSEEIRKRAPELSVSKHKLKSENGSSITYEVDPIWKEC